MVIAIVLMRYRYHSIARPRKPQMPPLEPPDREVAVSPGTSGAVVLDRPLSSRLRSSSMMSAQLWLGENINAYFWRLTRRAKTAKALGKYASCVAIHVFRHVATILLAFIYGVSDQR